MSVLSGEVSVCWHVYPISVTPSIEKTFFSLRCLATFAKSTRYIWVCFWILLFPLDLFVHLYASTTVFWLLQLCNVLKIRSENPPALFFFRIVWPFRVLQDSTWILVWVFFQKYDFTIPYIFPLKYTWYWRCFSCQHKDVY